MRAYVRAVQKLKAATCLARACMANTKNDPNTCMPSLDRSGACSYTAAAGRRAVLHVGSATGGRPVSTVRVYDGLPRSSQIDHCRLRANAWTAGRRRRGSRHVVRTTTPLRETGGSEANKYRCTLHCIALHCTGLSSANVRFVVCLFLFLVLARRLSPSSSLSIHGTDRWLILGPCFTSTQNLKFFKISRYIESLDTYIEY